MYTFGIWDFQANLSVFSICQSLQILRCNPPSLFFTTGSTLQLNSNLCLLQNKSCQQNKAIASQILHSARFNNCYQIFLQNIQSCFFLICSTGKLGWCHWFRYLHDTETVLLQCLAFTGGSCTHWARSRFHLSPFYIPSDI